MSLGLLHVSNPGCLASDITGDNHTVGPHELNRLSRSTQTDICRNSMSRMFLLHVSPYLYARGSNHSTIAQQLRRRCLDQSLVGHVCICVTFGADEIQPGSVCHSHRFDVCAG